MATSAERRTDFAPRGRRARPRASRYAYEPRRSARRAGRRAQARRPPRVLVHRIVGSSQHVVPLRREFSFETGLHRHSCFDPHHRPVILSHSHVAAVAGGLPDARSTARRRLVSHFSFCDADPNGGSRRHHRHEPTRAKCAQGMGGLRSTDRARAGLRGSSNVRRSLKVAHRAHDPKHHHGA